jgi:hypothetical protein
MTIDEALLLIAVAKERGIKHYKINTDNGDRTKSVDLTHEGWTIRRESTVQPRVIMTDDYFFTHNACEGEWKSDGAYAWQLNPWPGNGLKFIGPGF